MTLNRARTIAIALAGIGIGLPGCATMPGPAPVDKPCGVIIDSLLGVNATDRAGQHRLDVHYERGVGAGCWKRPPAAAAAPAPRRKWFPF